MKICGVYTINNTDGSTFYNTVRNTIDSLQDDGQEVEVQYQVNTLLNGQIVQSALILGRK
jgi:hypothetical protein